MAFNNLSSPTTGMEGQVRVEEVCLKFPPKVSSPGLAALILSNEQKETFMDFAGPRLHFQMILIFVFTQVIHNMLKHLGLPMFISQILVGMILGPMVFKGHDSLVTMSEDSVQVLGTVASFGYIFFLFLSGVKMDLSMTYKAGRMAVCIGLLAVVVPLTFCLITVKALSTDGELFENNSLFLAVTNSGTSFPVIHCLLDELKILNSELGRLGLSAALVSDIASLVLMNLSQWVKVAQEKSATLVLKDFGLAITFVLVVVFVLRPGMKWMVRRTPEGGQIKDVFLYAVILGFMSSPRINEFFNIFLLFGPFILGLAVPDGPPLGSALVEKLDPVVSGLFLPLFASTCGMRIDLSYLKKSTEYAQNQAIAAVVAVIFKFGVSLALPLLCKMPLRDSLALAFIMITKGIVEMGSHSFLFDNMVISQDLFAFMSIIIILLASIVPILVKRLYDPSRKYIGYQKRSIMHSKLKEELRMIGCIHVPGNVNSIINILNASCPNRENPIALDVLHLVKLSGRATPLFIAHQKHRKTQSNKSYSENVVLAFNQFERDNWEAVSVNVFTAVSPPNLMYEDICNLALDKLTSFILLPFHRRWYIDGSIESEDQAIRSLNCSILERAPCSVGILVEGRRPLKRSNSRDKLSSESSSYSIAVIFLGGKDDREALALAKRISQDQRVSLTVIHLKGTNNLGAILADLDRMLDDEMLRGVKEGGYIRYVDKQVNDGPETSSFLRSIVDDHQLIIVGRRYNTEDPRTFGLEEWSEFQEIGIIGDLLSSADFGGNYSVLIVQQQQLRIA
ncbi:PREDICTED: cation/H(+) antiporter 4 [Theobroma cacao]|uniref:Cation/H(+) antiporter 4 n=1 Tax=Theobroma cacao TaxID=3641 RepID=A0AB32UXT2_THECC|nr:PREDICTED: cation/H(+) antiporter 4 [Theobroma cacao]